MEKSSDQIVRPVTVKYVIALSLLAALATVNFLIFRTEIRDSQALATIAGKADRQRMLLHRTTILAERLVFSFDDETRSRTKGELLSDAFLLEKTHHDLMSPDSPRHLGVSDEVRSVYEKTPWLLDSEMRNYLMHIRSLANSEPEELDVTNPHLEYIRRPNTLEKIRSGLETVVDIYEAKSRAQSENLHRLAIWAFISTLVLLLLNGWFVFRPMVRQVRKDVVTLNFLNETLEQRVSERTAVALERAEQLAKSEAALLESQALYTSLVRHLPMCVLRKDCEGAYTFANEQFCEMVGKPLEDVVGKTDDDFFPPEMVEKFRSDDRYVMNSSAVFQDVEELASPDGEPVFVEVLKVALRDAQSKVVGVQVMFWDVTDRKQAEQRALQAERLAEIGQMVTGVAHESRNALQQIQACSQILKWELDGDQEKLELIDDLQDAEERLLRAFEELREYAAPMRVNLVPCDVREAVTNAWSATNLQRQGRDVSFAEQGDASMQCMGDALLLEQVFRNLFENAVAACDDPVRIDVKYELVSNDALRITVADNGPGFTAEQKARLFEPFFTTKTKGTGLGLAIVKRIVEQHGGHIRAESNGSKGAALVVTLPGRGTAAAEPDRQRHELGTL